MFMHIRLTCAPIKFTYLLTYLPISNAATLGNSLLLTEVAVSNAQPLEADCSPATSH